jgi:hypothetical protein
LPVATTTATPAARAERSAAADEGATREEESRRVPSRSTARRRIR